MPTAKPRSAGSYLSSSGFALHAALIIAACGLSYANSLGTAYHFDDEPIVFKNREIVSLAESESAGALLNGLFTKARFVGYLSFSLNYALKGTGVFGYHLANLAIHALNAVLVYALLLSLRETVATADTAGETRGPDTRCIALFAALLFAVHPVQTQAVTYIVQRFTSLATTFYLLGMLWFLRARNSAGIRSAAFLCASLTAGMLSMRTKEIGFTLPFMIFGAELLLPRTRRRPLLLLPYLPLIALNIIAVIGIDQPIEGVAGGLDDQLRAQSTLPRQDYLFTQFRVIATYLRLLLLPVNQNFDYDYPVFSSLAQMPVLLSALLIALIAAGCALFLVRPSLFRLGNAPAAVAGRRLVCFGVFWFFLALSVESSFIPILDVINEHRMYLPSVGIALAIAGAGFILGETGALSRTSNRSVLAACAAVIVLLAGLTVSRNRVWSDEFTFWADVTRKSPNKARGFYNLGLSHHEKKQLLEAVTFYSRALEHNPRHLKAFMNRGNALDDLGNPEAAIANYVEAIDIDPSDPEPYFNLGITYLRMNDIVRSRSYLTQACAMGSSSACRELRRLGWGP